MRFTFEDCPNEYTRELLDVLEKHNIRATFFVTGGGIAAYPELISRMAADGHSVGLHSMSLDEKFFAEDIRNFINELEEENALLDRVIKSRTRLVRAPNGSWSDKFHTERRIRWDQSGGIRRLGLEHICSGRGGRGLDI